MTSETARVRELHRYYQPWLALQVERQDSQSPARLLNPVDFTPRSSSDKALIALAQLAALRLNVKRAMVSLIGSSQQYILAEATQNLSLANDKRNRAQDHHWLGSTELPRASAVCEHALDSRYTAKNADGCTHTANALVVSDLRLDKRFKDRDYVKGETMLFYAGVPIYTYSGHKIGVYEVSSDQPRGGLDIDELKFMQDAAATVFEHLDLTKGLHDSIRGERMVRGLASFIEGSSLKSGLVAREEGFAVLKFDTASQRSNSPHRWRRPLRLNALATESSKEQRNTQDDENTRLSHPYSLKSNDAIVSPHNSDSDEPNVQTPQDSNAPGGSMQLFTRAARTIRESTIADGVVFFDATSGKTGLTECLDEQGSGGAQENGHGESTGSEVERFNSRSSSRHSSLGSVSNGERKAFESDSDTSDSGTSACEVLGSSMKETKLGTGTIGTRHLSLSEQELKQYIRRYSSGKVFNFSEQESLSSGDDTTSVQQAAQNASPRSLPSRNQDQKKRVHKSTGQELLRTLPGVRSVAFLPLWEFGQERWFAGAFFWTNRPGRLMDQHDELPYLKAFGNSIMSEVARLNALKSDQAKTTFIASISHELRSPLHGILGSVEFLHDTTVDAFQEGLITSIETCGKTLLDTIDHILDYSKINSFKSVSSGERTKGKNKRHSNSKASPTSPSSLDADFDVSILLEEVVEAVFAGQTFKRTRTGGLDHDDAPKAITEIHSLSEDSSLPPKDAVLCGQEKNSGALAVVLSIRKPKSWSVRSQPGALRRVIMNLFANALKYTESGFVELSLEAEDYHRQSGAITFELKVIDSGKGMSSEYLRDHLYRPFSQEDPFSTGTGLGMSIVRQIVDSLGGKIGVKSQQKIGTQVTVSLDLPAAAISCQTAQNASQCVSQLPQGLKLCILPAKHATETTEKGRRVAASLRETCEEWFSMEVIESPRMDNVDTDFFLYAEPPPIDHLLHRHRDRSKTGKDRKEIPLIIICTNTFEAASLRAIETQHLTQLGRVIEIVAQPCGPHKLAKVFEKCLHRAGVDISESASQEETAAIQPQVPRTGGDISLPLESTEREDADCVSSAAAEQQYLEARDKTTPNPTSVNEKPKIPSPTVPIISSRRKEATEEATHPPNRYSDPSIPSNPSSDKPYVLAVDDNHINLELLTAFMRRANFLFESAVNGLDALEKYKAAATDGNKRKFDYILTDILMPVMDGLTSTREIRKFEQEKGVVRPAIVIALTGLASEVTQREAIESGVNHFLVKPVNFKVLRELFGGPYKK